MRVFHASLLVGTIVATAILARSTYANIQLHILAQQEQLKQVKSDLESLREHETTGKVVVLGAQLTEPAAANVAPTPRPAGMLRASAGESSSSANRQDTRPEDLAELNAREMKNIHDTMESQFGQENTDPKWSRSADSEIRTKVNSRLPKESRFTSLECRTSMCRLEISHRDAQTYREFVNKTLSAADFQWPGPMNFAILRTLPSGEVDAVAYLVRPGYSQPTFETTE